MKKSIVLLFLSLISVVSFAQDIIITRKAEQLKVKIVEVSANEIKYKEIANLDGPLFILSTDQISSITFSNGKVTLFDQKAENQQVAAQAQEVKKPEDTGLITRHGRFYMYHNERLSPRQYVAVLKEECPQAYRKFSTGSALKNGSNALFVPGLICTAIGGGMLISDFVMEINDLDDSDYTTAIVLTSVGAAAVIISIPMRIVGSKLRRSSLDSFNTNCAKKPAAELNLNVKTNGLGLALNF